MLGVTGPGVAASPRPSPRRVFRRRIPSALLPSNTITNSSPLHPSDAPITISQCLCKPIWLPAKFTALTIPSPGDQHRDTAATTNPFLEQKTHVSEYSAREIATLQSRLDKQLGPEFVSTRPGAGGGKVHYLAAEKAINLANEVFGFNGWSSGIQNVQIDFVDENPQNGKITLGLSTIVRVTIRDGTYHEDIGYGHIENCKGKAAAFEKAKKEAATDALKRALRNFGNVLGNCLYDKDYLQKVQKIKLAPSRWDAENLHRHPDYAPIKRESMAEASEAQQKSAAAQRQGSVQSNTSFGSGEFEDDFGGNPFDENDISHPDEVRLDDTPAAAIETPAKRPAITSAPQQNGGGQQQQRQGVPRMHSMPQIRPPNVQSPAAIQNPQQPQKPQGPQRPSNNAVQGRMLPPPQHGMNNLQRPEAAAPQGPAHNHTNNSHSHSNPSSAGTTTDSPSHAQQQQGRQPNGPVANSDGEQLDSDGLPFPRNPPPGIPEGFITGRNAELLNQPPGARPPNTALAFNPHADSPSIRRTHGVNPGKSVPVMRQALNSANTAASAPPNNAGQGGPQPSATTSTGAQPQGNGMNGTTTPIRTNFVNPSADMNRRIGMPPAPSAAAHSVQNRGAYRPPAPAGNGSGNGYANALKRPPLSDVSNLHGQTEGLGQVDGAGDGANKKAKIDGGGVEVQSAGNATVVAGVEGGT